jgi:serpin B
MSKIIISVVLVVLVVIGGVYYVTHQATVPINPLPDNSLPLATSSNPSATSTNTPANQVPVQPTKTPVASPVKVRPATSTEIQSVVNANNQFAFDLYSRYSSKDGNVFFSPYSITTALAMTYEGAHGQTATEMQKVLHLTDNTDSRRAATASIYTDLNTAGKPFTLKTANALWSEKTYQFLPDYFSTIANYYKGNVTNLDFKMNPEGSRTTINSWVENQTNNKITNLIPQGAIDSLTRLVLTNAIYFKGTWVIQFNKSQTQKASFTTASGSTVQTDMMTLSGEKALFNYGETASAQILELPYSGNELSMLLILPKQGVNLDTIEKGLGTSFLGYQSSLTNQRVDVFMPKFTFKTTYSLASDLTAMGMPTAFSTAADFSGMTGNLDLYIGAVIHQAFVAVDEEGTEAAAATAVMMGVTSAMPQPIPVFRADHPFIFMIENTKTGEILFMGRVTNPTAQ